MTVTAHLIGPAGAGGVLLFLWILALLVVWCVPLIIALLFDLPNKGAIAVLSLLVGWTGVGWLAALVIAVVAAIRSFPAAIAPPYWPLYLPGWPASGPAAGPAVQPGRLPTGPAAPHSPEAQQGGPSPASPTLQHPI